MFRSLDAPGAPVPTLRVLRTADYSVVVQAGGPMFLPQRYRSFHVIGVPLTSDFAVARNGGARRWSGRLTSADVSLHPAGPGEHIEWPEGAACLYINLRPVLLQPHRVSGTASTIETRHRTQDSVIRDIGMALISRFTHAGDDRTTASLIGALAAHLARRWLTDGAGAVCLGARTLGEVLDELRAGDPATGTMADVARRCGLTRAHFTRRFRALTGTSPHAVMLGSRVERAKYLLTARGRTASEVAYETGFTDQSHLSHSFQRLVGMTPAKFRLLHEHTIDDLRSTILQDRRLSPGLR